MLAVVCGLPGAGKTTVSGAVADRLGATRLRTDVVRKDVLDDPDYTPEETRQVYGALLDRARATIEREGGVVLDGTFKYARQRVDARELAERVEVPFRLVKVECRASVVKRRIEAREGDESDATVAVHEQFKETFDAPADPYCRVDNSGDLAATYEQVDALF